jgi:hypothetical protein
MSRGNVVLAVAIAATGVAAITLAIDFTHPVPRLNVTAIVLVIITGVAWLAWLIIHSHAIAVEITLANQRVRRQHAEQRFRGLLSHH